MAPKGGSATLYGILYQLLGSLHHTVQLLGIRQRKIDETVVEARIIVEPPEGGGDIRIELPGGRVVEQWKARTSGRPWGLQEILDGVIPDLYLDPALDLADDHTNYFFTTEGHIGPKAQAFFQRLGRPVPERSPLAGLSKEDRKLFRATAIEVQKRGGTSSQPIGLAHWKLRRLLSRFKIRENQETNQLVQAIKQRLLALVDHVEDIPATIDQLCTIILRRGTGKGTGNEFMPKDILREAGLHGVSLEDENALRRKARGVLEREITRRNYDVKKDVREAPAWPENKHVLFLSGESGQGKTWQVVRLALDREKEGGLAVVVDSRGDAERDLERASDLLWKEAWNHDRPISLDRLAERWHEVRENVGRPWLTVCVENVQSLNEARGIVGGYDWNRWGVDLVLSGALQTGNVLAEEKPEQVHHVKLRDFTPAELREYLKRHDRSWETVPADVRDTLKRPLLAGLYTILGSDPDWAPTREYDLYERSWKRIERDLSENPEDLHLLKQLTLTLFDEEPRYPWTWDQLGDAGVGSETRARLEKVGWWTRTDEGVEVWHDRMLTWALAEALAQQGTVDDLANRLKTGTRPQNQRIRRILAYLPMDVLWLLSGNPARRHLVPDLLVRMEENERPFGTQRLYNAGLLPTLGLRIIPVIIERLRRLSDGVSYSYLNLAVEALSEILAREPDGHQDLPPLLTDNSVLVRKVAIKVLSRHPHAEAIDALWGILRFKSTEIEKAKKIEALSDRQSTFAALRACLGLNPGWLRSRIQESRPEEEPVWELAYLLANLKHPEARSIWIDVKSDLFEKVPPSELNSLKVCIRVFQDRKEVPRLEAWLSLEEKWTDNNAFLGIARVAPDRAVSLLETIPLKTLLASHRAWLPILLLNRPGGTRRALRERMSGAGEDFWEVAGLYRWYEEWMERETVAALLDRLAVEVAEASQGPKEARNRLRRPLQLLAKIHRVDLLECFRAWIDTDLDRSLGELGAASIDNSHHDLEELRTVLLKIGGKGFRRLIRAGLASPDPDLRWEAMDWCLICPEEIAAIAPREEWALAALGEDRALVEAIMAWEEKFENDDLTQLWRLRHWKPPMSDADLAPALEALRNTDVDSKVRGLAAVSISNREDLLSCLPEWLGDIGGNLAALDERAAYLVHRLAEVNPEGLQRLVQSLDVWSFPRTAVKVIYKDRTAELADRLERDLLKRWTIRGRLSDIEVDMALNIAQTRRISDLLLQAVWESRKGSIHLRRNRHFFTAICRIDSEEVRETIWKEAFEARYTTSQVNAIRALQSLEPEEALRAAQRGLEDPEPDDRVVFVSLLCEIGGPKAIPWLVEQAVREKKTEVRWNIGRSLRRTSAGVQTELRAKLASSDFRVRSAAAHLAGWQGSGFLETDLQRLAEGDPDNDVQWECLQALARQHKERCVLELMDAFGRVEGIARWGCLEAILELGDPRLLVTEDDPLWLGRVLTPELGALEVHANFRLKQRFKEVKDLAEQRDRSQKD